MLLDDPVFDVFKALFIRDVVDEHDPHRVVVVGGGDVHTVASCRRVGSWEGVGSKAGRELRWGGGKRRG